MSSTGTPNASGTENDPVDGIRSAIDKGAATILLKMGERLEREVRSTGNQTVTDAAWVGRALVALRESDRALALLEQVRPRGARLWFYLQAPEFDPVRSNSRFGKLVAESAPE